MRNRPLQAGLQALSRRSGFGAGLVVVVLVVSGMFGHLYVKAFVRWLGAAVGHDELVLRALGWAWLGVPLLVITALLILRRRLSLPARQILGTAAFTLAASSAMLLGRRGDSEEKVFGEVWPDAQPLGYGWGASGLSIVAMVVVASITYIIAGKIAGTPLSKPAQKRIDLALAPVCVVLLLGGLWIALTGPLPT